MTDERLLIPCTRSLLAGWTGPGVLTAASGDHQRVTISGDDDGVYLLDGEWIDYDPAYLPVVFSAQMTPAGTLSLDLSRAECRDRVVRVAAQHITNGGAPRPYLRCPTFARHGTAWLLDADSARQTTPFEWYDSADLHLDPNDDTRLPDGSRLVDALALAAVWREVSRG